MTALALAAKLEAALADYKETVTTVAVTDGDGDATEKFQEAVLKHLLERFLAEIGKGDSGEPPIRSLSERVGSVDYAHTHWAFEIDALDK